MHEPGVTVVQPRCAKRLRHQCIQPEQQPHGEDAHAHEHGGADAHGADRLGAEAPDHQCVDQAHGDPTELGEHDGNRQQEHRTELLAEIAPVHEGRNLTAGWQWQKGAKPGREPHRQGISLSIQLMRVRSL